MLYQISQDPNYIPMTWQELLLWLTGPGVGKVVHWSVNQIEAYMEGQGRPLTALQQRALAFALACVVPSGAYGVECWAGLQRFDLNTVYSMVLAAFFVSQILQTIDMKRRASDEAAQLALLGAINEKQIHPETETQSLQSPDPGQSQSQSQSQIPPTPAPSLHPEAEAQSPDSGESGSESPDAGLPSEAQGEEGGGPAAVAGEVQVSPELKEQIAGFRPIAV